MHINRILNEGYGLDDISELDVTPELAKAFPPLGELEGDYRELRNYGVGEFVHEFYTKKTAMDAYNGIEEIMNYEPYDYEHQSSMSEDVVNDIENLKDELKSMQFNIPNEPSRAFEVDNDLGRKLMNSGEHVINFGDKIVWGWNTSDDMGMHARPERILSKLR